MSDPMTDALVGGGIVVLMLVLLKAARRKKRVGGNTELWGTIFESLTHYVRPEGPLKEPKLHEEQRKIKDARDRDGGEV